FPLGLFGIAIATVILPALSKKHVDQSPQQFSATMDWGVRMVLLLGIPAMAGLIVLAKPMLMVLFMRGEFGVPDVEAASLSLMAYACGLVNFMVIKVLAPGYYARQDTKTPVKYGVIAMVSNMVFNAIFAYLFSYVGLAMATALSALINAGLLYQGLHRQGIYQLSRATLGFISKLVLAVSVMIGGLYLVMPALSQWVSMSLLSRSVTLGGLIVGGGALYLVTALLVGVRLSDIRHRG
ncbi:murein biosynthesis integral membrane protein MurJ, partial [Salinivibrio kushneri]